MVRFFEDRCEVNGSNLEAIFNQLIGSSDPSEKAALEAFTEVVRCEAQIGINMRPMVVRDFLENDRLMNVHEWAAHKSGKSNKSVEGILRDKLGIFFERRMVFDAQFEGGRGFRYGALNIGGLGAPRYGEYCAVFKQSDVTGRCQVGYLRSDSLNSYVTVELKINEAKLASECASESHKHMLAAAKHADQVAGSAREHWAQMLHSGEDYVEAILMGELSPRNLGAVRISVLDYELYWEYAYNEFRTRLSEVERYRVDSFAHIDEQLDALHIPWETVEDA